MAAPTPRTPKYPVGTKVLFVGQCQPPLTGRERIPAIVVKAFWDDGAWMMNYSVRDLTTGEVSTNNMEDMLNPWEDANTPTTTTPGK